MNETNQEKKGAPAMSATAKREEEILAYWNERDIFRKTLEKESPKGDFVFYDGPPFATGLPHFGHMLPTTMKDAIPRYRTMRGYRVARRWGWDCHGLPIENLVEKELGLSSKKDIEALGVGKFNRAARASVLRYADQWKEIIPRLGRWVDMDDDYRTMDPSYTESVWWSFKTLYDKGLVYTSFKSMHVCPRCVTTLSNFEVSQGYKDITDISVYVKFELEDEPGTFVLAWTTTPWTLPGNVALAVKPDTEYVKVEAGEEGAKAKYVIAKALFERHKDKFPGGAAVAELSAKDLEGRRYKPLFDYYAADPKLPNRENGWKIYAADFVTMDEGTGVVHIAPGFGSEDYELAQAKGIPFVLHVGMDGRFKPEVRDFAGESAKPKGDHQKTDIEIIKHLAGKKTLFAKEKVVHSYPHCWRCDTPLLNYATSSWFVKVTDLKERLLAENAKVNWVPEEIGSGRFGKWLDGARDWAISRSRYWGAPLPVWDCEACGAREVVGSVEDIRSKLKPRNSYLVFRHGKAENAVTGLVNSDNSSPVHLVPEGREHVAEVAKGLGAKPDVIYASPLLRTKETAEIIADALGYDKERIVYDERLREIGTGVMNGKTLDEYHGFFKTVGERFRTAPEGGESYTDVKRRMAEFLDETDRSHEGKTIVIVSHESPIWMMFAAAEGKDAEGALAMGTANGHFIDAGTVRTLDYVPLPRNEDCELDLHRPYIDSVEFPCSCGATMRRVAEVFDTWYDSGSMPFAQNHYPFENREAFEREGALFPADFIAEGLDQTRGWFYTLMVLGAGLFGRSPYKNVVVNGLILAEDGRKMSKSLKNYPDLMETVGKFGADALRYFLISSPAVRAEEVAFSEKGVDEVVKKVVLRLQNVASFYEMYESGEDADPDASPNVLDRWVLAKLRELAKQETAAMERYELDRASRPIAAFVDDLSTWYVRRSRDRFKGDDASDRAFALSTTRRVLIELSKLMAPFMPFAAEDLYLRMRGGQESVHLEAWPDLGDPDTGLIADMEKARKAVSLGLELRARANIKVRQPLRELRVRDFEVSDADVAKDLQDIMRDELNVKEISVNPKLESEAELDTNVSAELKEEGAVREAVRYIQDLRKKIGLDPADRIALRIFGGEAELGLARRHEAALAKATGASSVAYAPAEAAGEAATALDIDGFAVRLEAERS